MVFLCLNLSISEPILYVEDKGKQQKRATNLFEWKFYGSDHSFQVLCSAITFQLKISDMQETSLDVFVAS